MSKTVDPSYKTSDFCVIAAVDNDKILDQCLKRSPDIASGRVGLTEIRGAHNMASAYNQGLAETSQSICILAHQDVYLPDGWVDRAIEALDALEQRAPEWLVAGPYGVRADGRHAGQVWDVTMGRELGGPFAAPVEVGSFDELVLILRRTPGFQFDVGLPHFHLYGTDLAQTAWSLHRSSWAVNLPVVHNNRPIVSLGGGYADAYQYCRNKWRDRLPIETTICTLTYNPMPLWRARWRRRKVKTRGSELQADAQTVARQAGYE
ncbi:MAG: glycosyltransferase [Erythrobacter sp.]